MEWDSTVALVAMGVLVLSWYMKRRRLSPLSQLPLPPGPKGLPLIGNMLDMPTSFEWKTYHRWAKELHTDIIHLNVAGTSIIVLDTAEAVTELFERRSSIYSNRARMPMINELMGWDFNFGFMQYGERWRRHRRLMHHNFHPAAARRFRPYSLRAARNLLNRFLDFPNDVLGNLRQMAGETIMSVAYGLDVQPMDDPYIKTAELGVRGLVTAAVPGSFLVDIFPSLKYVPEWMPGAGFKKKAREWRKWARDMVEVPYEAAKENIATGIAPPSVASLCLQKMDEGVADNAYVEDVIQGTIGSLYTAGTDTTISAVASCILGLLEKPGVLKKAQQELDSVVKTGHLPDFADQDHLPYITAIAMETLRWRDVAPIALPRHLDNDDEYKGYRLPAGSIVIANAWSMLHDEEVYPDPFTFNPERFMKDGKLDTSVRNPSHACWGFGRRICPGRYMAFSSIWIAIASLIAVFDIKKAVDEDGNVIEPCHESSAGLIAFPKPFKCSITPRSKDAEKLIRSVQNMDILLS